MVSMINLVILSGVSGAGKSTVSHVFEELNYRLIENIPNPVLPSLMEAMLAQPDAYERTVLILELRNLAQAIEIVRPYEMINLRVFLLDCQGPELISRYRLTRHIHPLQAQGYNLEEAIEEDARSMEICRKVADFYLDTTGLDVNTLRQLIFANVTGNASHRMVVNFASFGYKYGAPTDGEIVFDCRSVPNPFWDKELRPKTGQDPEVKLFLESKKETIELLGHMIAYLDYYLSEVSRNGRNYIFIYCGCSGGQHRSVYFAERLFHHYQSKYICTVSHRELRRIGK